MFTWLSWIKVIIILMRTFLLNSHLVNDLAGVFIVKLEHTVASEVIVAPIEKLKMVPAVNARDQNIAQSSVNGQSDI